MAQLTIPPINVPDQDVGDLLDGLAYKYPQKFADPDNPTGAEAQAAARDWLIYRLREVYRDYMRYKFRQEDGADGGIT